MAMRSYLTHLEGPLDGSRHDPAVLQTVHQGRPLVARYDLTRLKREHTRDELARRPANLWKWRELLPVQKDENIVSLGEEATPLLPCARLGAALGVEALFIKDESHLPTGSFKARGLALAISRAKELGVTRVAIPTAGNAGGALAAYAARAGMEAYVFMPSDTPVANQGEAALFGARTFLVDGLITDCAALVQAGTREMGWFDVSTLKEPYRLEGKKTMGLELAEQLDWQLPDAILYPTGGGTGLIGMAKAFDELAELGWIASAKRPRFYACQSDGCAPIVRAFEAGERFATPFENATTRASGLRVPKAVGDFLILDAVRASRGAACAAPEAEILPWMQRASALEGLSLCPETGACLAVLESLVAKGALHHDERIVVFNTGAAQKYVECLPQASRRLARGEHPDWAALARS
jgi:threonine synthase